MKNFHFSWIPSDCVTWVQSNKTQHMGMTNVTKASNFQIWSDCMSACQLHHNEWYAFYFLLLRVCLAFSWNSYITVTSQSVSTFQLLQMQNPNGWHQISGARGDVVAVAAVGITTTLLWNESCIQLSGRRTSNKYCVKRYSALTMQVHVSVAEVKRRHFHRLII